MKSDSALRQIQLLSSELDAAGIRAAIDGLMLTGLARVVRRQLKGNHGGHVTRKALLALAETFAENAIASFRGAAGEAIDKLAASP